MNEGGGVNAASIYVWGAHINVFKLYFRFLNLALVSRNLDLRAKRHSFSVAFLTG